MPKSSPLLWLKPGCLRWLTRDHPDVKEAHAAAMRIVKDGSRAAEIAKRIRLLFNKSTLQLERGVVNEAIREMPRLRAAVSRDVLLRSDAARYNITVRVELPEDLTRIMGDRVQLKQVLMNLMVEQHPCDEGSRWNAGVDNQFAENDEGRSSGVRQRYRRRAFPTEADQVFNAFFTTKPHGTGMGLRISHSIVKSHSGRLSTTPRAAQAFIWLYLRKSRQKE